MSTHGNKRTVETFLSHFGRCDIRAVLDMMADDATWWVNGKPDLHPDAGSRTKAEMAAAWRDLYALLEGGLRMDVVAMVAEGDRVAAEVRSHAITKAGKVYDNGYHMLFTVRDGKIAGVREYTDLLHAAATFG